MGSPELLSPTRGDAHDAGSDARHADDAADDAADGAWNARRTAAADARRAHAADARRAHRLPVFFAVLAPDRRDA